MDRRKVIPYLFYWTRSDSEGLTSLSTVKSSHLSYPFFDLLTPADLSLSLIAAIPLLLYSLHMTSANSIDSYG